ncbi:SDR family NAD(P)-dependent oxidoreductase [Bradyrhizobium oropedii]|uniref:SDR family NAD(P)-dependent oxidoreductase n=1 Tax=Bradyrhizobium oropedii TaxID=1571201 RepID=UPI001E56BC11|nr:SDR family NAD(P)-dependent oxidoreductase [Bradyrhizobium oropedii]
MRFCERTALVTGDGTGIGAAVARRLSSESANVAVMDRRREPLQAWLTRPVVSWCRLTPPIASSQYAPP